MFERTTLHDDLTGDALTSNIQAKHNSRNTLDKTMFGENKAQHCFFSRRWETLRFVMKFDVANSYS